jgi:hypothetical protein
MLLLEGLDRFGHGAGDEPGPDSDLFFGLVFRLACGKEEQTGKQEDHYYSLVHREPLGIAVVAGVEKGFMVELLPGVDRES